MSYSASAGGLASVGRTTIHTRLIAIALHCMQAQPQEPVEKIEQEEAEEEPTEDEKS